MRETPVKPPLNILAEPYTQQQLARFEILIFNANSNEAKIRHRARNALAAFVEFHGKEKCDLMLAKLAEHHDKPKRPDA